MKICYNRGVWSKELILYWCNHYCELRNYELNPFSEIHISGDEIYVSGKGGNAPYIETCDLNWEFDKALKKLGSEEAEFRRIYIDGEGRDSKLFNKFLALLKENDNEP